MRSLWLPSLLLVAGCGGGDPPPAPAVPRTLAVEAVPADGLWLPLGGAFENLRPVGSATHIGWVPITAMRPEGDAVVPGDELLRFDSGVLGAWLQRQQAPWRSHEERRRSERLRLEGEAERLRARLADAAAARAAVAADLAQSRQVDPEQVRIAELALANARAALEAARRRRERLEGLAAAGGAVAGAELQRAREEQAQAEAGLAAPEVELELARLTASAASIRRLELVLADLDAQRDGLAAELAAAEERVRARERVPGSDWRERYMGSLERLLADPVVRAAAAGDLAYRDDTVRIGGKVANLVPCAFVLDRAGLEVRLQLPERLRPLVSAGGADATRIAIAVPALGERPLAGRLHAVAAAPETAPDGSRSFRATVRIADIPPGIRPGMRVAAQVALEMAGSPVLVPGFCLAGGDAPAVLLADGTRRELRGFAAGGSFVALAGLAPGDRVRVPDTAPPPGRERIQSIVGPSEFVPVRLRSWGWQPVELLPEGTPVRKGERIARLAKTEHWRDPDDVRASVDANLIQARLDMLSGRAAASAERARSIGDWRRAELARDRAAIELEILRRSWDPAAIAGAQSALARAGIARERAEQELATAEAEVAAGGLSRSAAQARAAAADRARAQEEQRRLELAAAIQSRSWLDLLSRSAALADATDGEERARALWAAAGESFRAQLAAATAGFVAAQRGAESELSGIADEEVFAPADGILVYHPGRNPLRVGTDLDTMEPFRIATGDGLRAELPVPARWYGRFRAGESLDLSAPGLGQRTIRATITAVAPAFLPRPGAAAELAFGRTISADDRVFLVTVAFPPPPGGLPPGGTVHADL